MATYTFILDYQNGTYISQKEADDLRSACFAWKEEIATGGYIPGLNPKVLTEVFEESIDEFPPQPIDGLQNVWLFHIMLDDDMMDVHIVQTDTKALR